MYLKTLTISVLSIIGIFKSFIKVCQICFVASQFSIKLLIKIKLWLTQMHPFISFNRQVLPASESFLASVSAAALYGKGIFTTVAIYKKDPFLWEKHWRRLNDNAEKIGVELSGFAEEAVKNSLLETIEKNKITNARVRITFFDERASCIWQFETGRKTSLLITTANFREIESDFRLTVSPFRVNSASPLAGVKSCNYLENILALEKARAHGFAEAVRLNERGEIVSACMSNVFWLKDEQVFTPSLKTGCLAGTTRGFVLENRECFEVEAELKNLYKADAIFLTSAGLGITRVSEFEGKQLATSLTLKLSGKISQIY